MHWGQNMVTHYRSRDFQLGIFRDHFFQAVGNETDGEFEVVAGAFGAEDGAVTVFGVFHASTKRPGAGGFSYALRVTYAADKLHAIRCSARDQLLRHGVQ